MRDPCDRWSEQELEGCYECGSLRHTHFDCPGPDPSIEAFREAERMREGRYAAEMYREALNPRRDEEPMVPKQSRADVEAGKKRWAVLLARRVAAKKGAA